MHWNGSESVDNFLFFLTVDTVKRLCYRLLQEVDFSGISFKDSGQIPVFIILLDSTEKEFKGIPFSLIILSWENVFYSLVFGQDSDCLVIGGLIIL